jgi:hypothetical protein
LRTVSGGPASLRYSQPVRGDGRRCGNARRAAGAGGTVPSRWDVFAWNRLNSIIFRDYAAIPAAERNLMEILFTRPSYFKDPGQFESMARRVLSKMRVDYSNSGGDPRFEALIGHLESISPLFRRIWRTPEINPRSYGTHRFTHEIYGPLCFEHTSYVPDGHPSIEAASTAATLVVQAICAAVRASLHVSRGPLAQGGHEPVESCPAF